MLLLLCFYGFFCHVTVSHTFSQTTLQGKALVRIARAVGGPSCRCAAWLACV